MFTSRWDSSGTAISGSNELHIEVRPREGNQFSHTDKATGKLLVYLGRVEQHGDTVYVIPSYPRASALNRMERSSVLELLTVGDIWDDLPDGGRVTHLSMPADLLAAYRARAASYERNGRSGTAATRLTAPCRPAHQTAPA